MHLDQNNTKELTGYLRHTGLILPGETLTGAEKAGEGNMNYTLRIRTADRTFILKQARPYVEKYPSIPAPVERAGMEAAFFKVAGAWAGVGELLPSLLFFDPENHIQAIEDLGEGADFTAYYKRENPFPEAVLGTLTGFLRALHSNSAAASPGVDFSNRAMRELNHLHIFDFPFQPDNKFPLEDIQPGLQAVAARTIFSQPGLRERTLALGQRYLADGDTLLHGDFFPGSWLWTDNGVFVIDPEFCFRGESAFDLGVFLAHLRFCGIEWPRAIAALETGYGAFDRKAVQAFAAVEILRRLYGVAQLPLDMTPEEKEALTHEVLPHLAA